MGKYVLYKKKDNVGILTLNAPEIKNAFTGANLEELAQAIYKADRDDDIKVIILKGAKGCFTAGGNLKAASSSERTVEIAREDMACCDRAILAIQKSDKPIFAQLEGYAIGGGFSLALACDLIFAASNAKMAANYMRVGLCPEMGTMLFLPSAIGLYRARELFYSGRMISAEEAYTLGIVSKIFPEKTIDKDVFEYASDIVKLPKTTLTMMKKQLNSIVLSSIDNVCSLDIQNNPVTFFSKECAEYMANNFMKK